MTLKAGDCCVQSKPRRSPREHVLCKRARLDRRGRRQRRQPRTWIITRKQRAQGLPRGGRPSTRLGIADVDVQPSLSAEKPIHIVVAKALGAHARNKTSALDGSSPALDTNLSTRAATGPGQSRLIKVRSIKVEDELAPYTQKIGFWVCRRLEPCVHSSCIKTDRRPIRRFMNKAGQKLDHLIWALHTQFALFKAFATRIGKLTMPQQACRFKNLCADLVLGKIMGIVSPDMFQVHSLPLIPLSSLVIYYFWFGSRTTNKHKSKGPSAVPGVRTELTHFTLFFFGSDSC